MYCNYPLYIVANKRDNVNNYLMLNLLENLCCPQILILYVKFEIRHLKKPPRGFLENFIFDCLNF